MIRKHELHFIASTEELRHRTLCPNRTQSVPGIGPSPSELWNGSSSSYSSSLCQMKQATSPENDLSKPNQQRFLGMTTMFAGCDVNSDLDKRMNVVTKATSAGLDTPPPPPPKSLSAGQSFILETYGRMEKKRGIRSPPLLLWRC